MTGDIKYTGSTKTPNIGGIFSANGSNADIELNNCINVGTITLPTTVTGNVGFLAGSIKENKTTSVANCYTTGEVYLGTTKMNTVPGVGTSNGEYSFDETYTVLQEQLAVTEMTELIGLFGSNASDVWMCHANARGTKAYGTPMLKQFADLWLAKHYKMEADTSWYDPENPETEYTLLLNNIWKFLNCHLSCKTFILDNDKVVT